MATGKQINELTQAGSVGASDVVAIAQSGNTEATKASMTQLAQAIGEINESGALSELVYATSQGKALLAQNLTEKGVPTESNETLIQMADKVGALNVDDTKENIAIPACESGAYVSQTYVNMIYCYEYQYTIFVYQGKVYLCYKSNVEKNNAYTINEIIANADYTLDLGFTSGTVDTTATLLAISANGNYIAIKYPTQGTFILQYHHEEAELLTIKNSGVATNWNYNNIGNNIAISEDGNILCISGNPTSSSSQTAQYVTFYDTLSEQYYTVNLTTSTSYAGYFTFMYIGEGKVWCYWYANNSNSPVGLREFDYTRNSSTQQLTFGSYTNYSVSFTMYYKPRFYMKNGKKLVFLIPSGSSSTLDSDASMSAASETYYMYDLITHFSSSAKIYYTIVSRVADGSYIDQAGKSTQQIPIATDIEEIDGVLKLTNPLWNGYLTYKEGVLTRSNGTDFRYVRAGSYSANSGVTPLGSIAQGQNYSILNLHEDDTYVYISTVVVASTNYNVGTYTSTVYFVTHVYKKNQLMWVKHAINNLTSYYILPLYDSAVKLRPCLWSDISSGRYDLNTTITPAVPDEA